jgi:signal transduction histidine kinase
MLLKRNLNLDGGSIRTQLVVSNIFTLAVLLVALGFIVHYAVRSTIMNSVDRQLEHQTDPLGRPRPPGPPPGQPPPPGQGFPSGQGQPPPFNDGGPPGGPPPPGPPNGLPPGPAAGPWDNRAPPPPDNSWASREQNQYRPHRFDLTGRSLDMREAFAPWSMPAFNQSSAGATIYTDIVIDGQRYRLLSRPFPSNGAPLGVIQDVYQLSDLDHALGGLDSVLLTLLPLALGCAGLAGYLLTGRVLGRVRQMTKAAARIGENDFSQRIPVSGHDEFAELAGTFNGLLGRLEAAIRRQVQLNEQRRRFTADASHELKTPLTIIKGNAGILLWSMHAQAAPSPSEPTPGPSLKGGEFGDSRAGTPAPHSEGRVASAEFRESIEEIDQAADTMSRLVRDLLLLAQFDDGQLGKNTAALSLSDIVGRAAAAVVVKGHAVADTAPHGLNAMVMRTEPLSGLPDSAGAQRGNGSSMTTDIEPGIRVRGNEEELVRLFSNLLANAKRHTPADGVVALTAKRVGRDVVVSIRDSGVGIAPEHLPHLGERFYRVDTARSRNDGGTGLGLSICKSIALAHKGTMRIESTVGIGTTVIVSLPVDGV